MYDDKGSFWERFFPGGERGFRAPSFRGGEGKGGSPGWWERIKASRPTTRWIIAILVIALAVIVFAGNWLATFYTDLLWYREVGQASIFWKRIWAQVLLFLVSGAVFFAILYSNLWLARRLTPRYERPLVSLSPLEESVARFRERAGRWLDRGILVFSIVVSLLAGWNTAAHWEKLLVFLNAVQAGKSDPVFGKDLGFYLFRYPFHVYLASWIFSAFLLSLVLSAVAHFLYGAISFSEKGRRFASHVKAHLSALAAALLIIQAWRFRLDMFGLLHSSNGTFNGANYTDVHARIPAYWVLIAVSLISAVLFLLNIRYRGWRLPLVGLVALVAVSLLAGSLYPLIVQNYVVKPKELEREREYLGYNIEFTQDAYNLQDEGEKAVVERRQFPAELGLTYQDILENRATVSNVRVWDPRLAQQVFNQRQELRQEYDFNDVDVDRYTVAGDSYTQVLISARELSVDQLRPDARTWQNERLSYTHGYGFCMVPTNEHTPEGDPIFWVKDIPPVVKEDLGLSVTRPEIYYGEKAHDYVAVRTGALEIDYPAGNTNVYVDPYYQGTGGVQVSSFLRRLAFSVRFRDISLLFSGYINRESRILFRRNVVERAREVAPFLTFDRDPYLVVDDEGRLMWIIDAYTTSDLYPYSQHYEGELGRLNYIRNSVKVVVDAFNGNITFYLVDPDDPVAATYSRVFPSLFTPAGEMPEGLKRHLRYPEDLFKIQMDIFRTYHIDDVDAFYQKEDVWDIPNETYGVGNQSQPVQPYYVILRIPGEEREEMVLMQPFVPRGKNNLVDWVAARCDGENYGKILNFSFPPGKLVNGPQQFEALVDQDPAISQQITLWNQAGSQVIRGNTLVIPIEESLLFVEPLYLLAQNPAIPQLRKVIVGYGDRVVMEDTLEAALARIFGKEAPAPQVTPGPAETEEQADREQLARRAKELYDQAQSALRNGDWAGYGARMEELGRVLERLAGK
ncbi:MAG: UPF0182 family protein [Candidatus Geothermincolales bacterium]